MNVTVPATLKYQPCSAHVRTTAEPSTPCGRSWPAASRSRNMLERFTEILAATKASTVKPSVACRL